MAILSAILYEFNYVFSQHPVFLMADEMATRMPSFSLQPHHLAISHGIARKHGPLSDTDNSSFYIIFFLCVGVGGGGWGYGLFKVNFLLSSRSLISQWWAETGVRGEFVTELGVSHKTRARLVPIAVRI